MGIIVFLIVCWLVAYVAAGGWPRARGHLVSLASRVRQPVAVPAQPGAQSPGPVRRDTHTGPEVVPAPPTLADLEFPVRAPEGPSMEGRLVTALLAGAVSPEHYHKAMHVLAAHDERAHPMPPVPS